MEETLKFIKETKNTVVYGNDDIQGIYIPKSKFDTTEYPKEIKLTITF